MFALPVSVTVFDIVGFVSRVEGASMQPTLNPDGPHAGDVVYLNKWACRQFKFNRGDIVSFVSPRDPSECFLKRIIGLEGDVVKKRKNKNKRNERIVYVKVPQGHCWVEGDNHKHSIDSNDFGPLSMGLIYAKATYIVWPFSRWRKLE